MIGRTVVKNRLHLDVSPIDGSTEDEVTRLLGLGATKTDVGQGSDQHWEVTADPEGNEFCVLRTLAPQNQAGWRTRSGSVRTPGLTLSMPRRRVQATAFRQVKPGR